MQPARGDWLHIASLGHQHAPLVRTIGTLVPGTGDALVSSQKGHAMSDTIFLFTTLAFFALAWAYTRACAWL
jgi:hypothetical protein